VQFNPNKSITADAAAGITWLDLERIEERYLLAACADGGQCMPTWKNFRREFRDLQPLNGGPDHTAMWADRQHLHFRRIAGSI
jgi:hypothetical protein